MPQEKFQVKDFDLSQPFIVLKDMNIDGRKYKQGDLFPHHKYKVQPRRLAQLFDRRFIGHVPDGQSAPIETPEAPPVPPVQTSPPVTPVLPAENAPQTQQTQENQPPAQAPVVDQNQAETALVNAESAAPNPETEKVLDDLFKQNEGDPTNVI